MAAPPYPRIENLYVRAADGKSLDVGVLRRDTTQLITRWLATEKIDGTNIRVSLEPEYGEEFLIAGEPSIMTPRVWGVRFYGRTNRAQMPDFIQEYLEATFTLENMSLLWRGQKQCPDCKGWGLIAVAAVGPVGGNIFDVRCACVEPYPITLYGEAYGARIQRGGGDYRRDGDISFRLFDVLVAEKHWLNWENIVSIAQRVGVKTVPLLDYGQATTDTIVAMVRAGFKSEVAFAEGTPRLAEGIVARTDPYLFDNNGRRVVFKTKTKDY